ncbi:MAG: right-handed parallel beta-helix repeat-containing protein, partial [Alphaproteobacteria bacterium]|nr:right-handed parallel beta-helix repeat-containing protein [Alphaproteobacteria bacterium]
LSISGLQFRGNRPLQKQRSPDGQAPFGLYLRGGCTDIDIQECTFRDLGNSSVPANRTGGGGIVLGPIPGAPDQTVENITIRHCRFAANGNVPGIYIGGGDMPGFRRRNISVLDNEFEGVPEGTRAQNCIYILAESPAAEITNVTIANNRFHVDAMVDALIELNWVRSFTITGNSGVFDSALPDSSAMLIRDGAVDGVISANSFVNRSGVERVVGIILVNFVDPGEVSGIVITGNSLRGFSRAGIAVDRGSNTVIVQGNRIEGPGNAGIRIAAASNVLVANNLLSGLQTAIQLAARTPGAPTRGVQLTGNRITDSGGDGACLIDVDGDLIDVQDLLITHTAVHSPRAGTKALASGRFRKADGNILRDNQVGSLALVAGGEEGGYETIRKADD